ncbi:MAG: hypothetical protein OXC53_05920 [Rhodobacteraceae bacterium]|nr:hypothetical protein [Paracoccaceae bacterium]
MMKQVAIAQVLTMKSVNLINDCGGDIATDKIMSMGIRNPNS